LRASELFVTFHWWLSQYSARRKHSNEIFFLWNINSRL